MESNNTYRCAGANRLKRISTTVSVGSTCFRVKIALNQCLLFMLMVGGALSGTLAETTKTPGTGTTTESVVALLNADGTLNLHTGFRGALSAEGWTMVTDASGRPRFVRAGESGARSASRAALSRHSGGNGAWDDRFSFPGVEGEVYAIAVSGGDVYVGGAFSSAGGIPGHNIARWDGQNWFALGPGVDGPVYAIAVNGEEIWVGGKFASAGLQSVNNLATWDPKTRTWSKVSATTDDTVKAIVIKDDDVYVGGAIVGGLLKYDGSQWQPLANGVNGAGKDISLRGKNGFIRGALSLRGGETALAH